MLPHVAWETYLTELLQAKMGENFIVSPSFIKKNKVGD